MATKPHLSLRLHQQESRGVLERQIAALQERLVRLSARLTEQEDELSEFSHAYEAKVRSLQGKLKALESQIAKYQQIRAYVDELLSMEEAEAIYDDAMDTDKERQAHGAAHTKSSNSSSKEENPLPADDKRELKRLYRELARQFHPDLTGGDTHMMKRINEAYALGDIETLRQIVTDSLPINRGNGNPERLKEIIDLLKYRIRRVISELKELRTSDVYVLKNDYIAKDMDPFLALDTLAFQINEEIERKTAYLQVLKQTM